MRNDGFYIDLPPENQEKSSQNCSVQTGSSNSSLVVNTSLNWIAVLIIVILICAIFILLVYISDLRTENHNLVKINNQLATKLSIF